uniref:Putative tail protein n=1 Tax=viral metagenome TaxID=1070528 RepID=A0A6M3KHM8_9ZZZZ
MNRVTGDKLKQVFLDPTPDADHQASGIISVATVGENVAFGECLYLKTDGKYWRTDADAAATTIGKLAVALATILANAAGPVLEKGYIRDDTWNWATVGGAVYLSTTGGEFTQTAPSGAGDVVRIVGYAAIADVIYFDPAALTLPVPVNAGGTGVESLTDHGVLVGSGVGAITPLAVGTNGQVLVGSTGADPVFASITAGDNITLTLGAGTLEIGVTHPLLHIEDQKAAGTLGGTFTSGAWRTRDLTTVCTNTIAGASLSSNQITLPAGTYDIVVHAPGYRVLRNMAILYNVTDSAETLWGSSEYAIDTYFGLTKSIIMGRLTIAGEKVFEIRHKCQIEAINVGFGVECNSVLTVDHETYTQVWIKKVG